MPAWHIAAGNPARVIRKIETMGQKSSDQGHTKVEGVEEPMAEAAQKLEDKGI